IRLSRSMPYLSDQESQGISGANVSISDLETGREFHFRETEEGVYQWQSRVWDYFVEIGKTYELKVNLNGDSYTARSKVFPVPPVDSIVYGYEDKAPFQEAGYQAYLIAFDPPGETDYYFIRSYKNGVLRSRNIDFTICIDAA